MMAIATYIKTINKVPSCTLLFVLVPALTSGGALVVVGVGDDDISGGCGAVVVVVGTPGNGGGHGVGIADIFAKYQKMRFDSAKKRSRKKMWKRVSSQVR